MTEFLDFLGSYWWVLLIFVVFIYSAFEEWLEFKTEQRKLGASTEETEEKVEELRAAWETEQKRLNTRIQHLETIVTSQVWDAIHEEGQETSSLPDDLDEPAEPTQEEKAKRLARRLRNG